MGLAFLIILGAILGWLASIVLDSEGQPELFLNVFAGISGACAMGLGVSPMVGGGTLLGDEYSVTALLLALVGSLVAIAGANLLRVYAPR